MMQTQTIINIVNDPRYMVLFLALALWSLVWKGIALWRAAKNGQRNWFIVLLVVNTLGILEIVYVFYFQAGEGNKPKTEEKPKI